MKAIFLAAVFFMMFQGNVNATTPGITNVPAYAYVGTEYTEMNNKMLTTRDINIPNLSNGVCNSLAASYVTDGFVTIVFPDLTKIVTYKRGKCVQMFNPVADNLL